MKSLKNKVIIVAGGAGGIGSETCKLLASGGAIIILAGRPNTRIPRLARELKKLNHRSTSIETDLRTATGWDALVQQVSRQYHRIDCLVNCMGMIVPGALDTLTDPEIENVISTNFKGIVEGVRAVLPAMKRQKEGCIVNVGSLGGIVPMSCEAIYSATKFAVRGFTLSMSEELRDTGIDVSLVSPGPVRTRMLDTEANDDRSTISFVNRPLKPEEVASAILSVILKPRKEIILPKISGTFALLLSLFPGLSGLLFRVLDHIGKLKLRTYRKTYLKEIPLLPTGI